MRVKFEICILNRFKLSDWLVRCAQTHRQTDRQTDRHTSNENSVSAIYFVHLAETTSTLFTANEYKKNNILKTALQLMSEI